jgi:hypothetical protein
VGLCARRGEDWTNSATKQHQPDYVQLRAAFATLAEADLAGVGDRNLAL